MNPLFNKDKILEKIIEDHENGFIIIDEDIKVKYSNKTAKKYFKEEYGELIGNYLHCKDILKEEEACGSGECCKICRLREVLIKAKKLNEPQYLEDIKNINGADIKNINCKITYEGNNYILELYFTSKQEKRYLEMLKILDKSGDGLFMKSKDFKYQFANDSFSNFLQVKRENIYSKLDAELVSPERAKNCLKGDLETIENGTYTSVEKLGDRYYRIFKEKIEEGILGVVKDITNEVTEKINSEIDELTGLYNRRKYKKNISEIYKKKASNYYLMLLDLDNLRDVNNTYGHLKGDIYLERLGKILKNNNENFYRIGGDEFAGLIKGSKEEIEKIIEKIYYEIKKTLELPDLSVSIGCKKMDFSKEYAENYVEVDKILYKVKKVQKGKYKLLEN